MQKNSQISVPSRNHPISSFIERHTPAFLKFLSFLSHASKDVQNVFIPYAIHIGKVFKETNIEIEGFFAHLRRKITPSKVTIN